MKKLLLLSLSVMLCSPVFSQTTESEKAMKEMMNSPEAAKLMEMMGSMMNAETRSVYKFPVTLNMRITDHENGKKDVTDIKYHVNATEQTFAFMGKDEKMGSDKAVMIVYDAKNSAMVMVDEKEKSFMAMNTKALEGMDFEKMMQQHSGKTTTKDIKCTKSGKSKTIQGYTSQEHVCIDEEKKSRAEVWVTDKLPVNISKAAKGTPWAMYVNGLDGMNGMMMQGKFYENGKLEAEMEVTEVNTKSDYNITMSKYKKMDMFGGGR